MNIPRIRTENLLLRPFAQDDAPAMHHILNGKDVLQYFPVTQAPSYEQVQAMIDRLLTHWQDKGYGLWALAWRATGELMGRCGLQHISETDEVEIDFILDRSFWGRGFATEAGRASLQHAYDHLKLSTVVGIVHPDNVASQRVLEKLEMRFTEETVYFGMSCYRYVGQQPLGEEL